MKHIVTDKVVEIDKPTKIVTIFHTVDGVETAHELDEPIEISNNWRLELGDNVSAYETE